MKKLLTIAVPAYQAESYLRTNLDAFCQTEFLEKIEVIVIDDGSTDRTGSIADEYAEKYPDTVKVIHKENGGHGSGVNAGIDAAEGLYFKVVDADDWVEKEPFSHLLENLEAQAKKEKPGSDAVVSGFYWVYDEGTGQECNFRRKAEIKEPFSGVEYGKNYRFDEISSQVYIKMHGLTIRTEILQKHREAIRLDEHCYYVDAEYILYPIPYIETITFIPDFVYQYRLGREGQSVSPEKLIKNRENYDRVLRSLLCFYEKCRNKEIVCSRAKLSYIEMGIARIAAGRIKILLSLPGFSENKNQLKQFDSFFREKYPGIYRANKNKAVWALRKSRYALYGLASWMVRRKFA